MVRKILVSLLLVSTLGFPCSTFYYGKGNNFYLAKTYDWDYSTGAITVNKKNQKKSSLVMPGSRAIGWTSKYGSVTFNQYGHEFPIGGMNQAGLIMETLWLNEAKYPTNTKYPLNEGQIVQYVLDNFGTVEEVVKNLGDVDVKPVFAKIHYFLCDATKNCAVIEHKNGKRVIRTSLDNNMSIPALANNFYDDSITYIKKFETFGGTEKSPAIINQGNLPRFYGVAKASYLFSKTSNNVDPIEYGFNSIKATGIQSMIGWRLVYDVTNRKIHFENKVVGDVKTLNLNNLNFSCKEPNLTYDMDLKGSGDIESQLRPFSLEENSVLIKKVTEGISPILVRIVERYPSTVTCEE